MQHVGKQMPKFGKGKDVFQTVEMRRLWPDIVGEYLAQKTFVKKIYLQKLVVSVEHGGWSYQLNMMKADIMAKIQKQSKVKITDIQWHQEDISSYVVRAQPKTVRNKFVRAQPVPEESSVGDIISRVRALQKDMQK